MADVDARYRAKLDARANGTTPVHVSSPVQLVKTVYDNSVDGLYRQKLELRALAQTAAAAKPEEESKSETADVDQKSKKR